MTKQSGLDHAVASLQAQHGKDVLQWLCETKQAEKVSTGLEELDSLLDGGLPEGRLIEVFGLRQSGKTAVACQLASQLNSLVFIDAEHKMSEEMASVLHLPDKTIILNPENLEEALSLARDLIKAGFEGVIIDSLPALAPLKEMEEKDMEKNIGFSPTAGLLSRKLPVFLQLLHKTRAIFIVVNQQRANVNAVAFGEQYHTFGGLALPYYASVRIATARKQWLKHDKLGVYGMELAVLVDKANTCTPRKGVGLPLVYDIGIIPNAMLKEARQGLIAEGKAPRPMPTETEIDVVTVQEELTRDMESAS